MSWLYTLSNYATGGKEMSSYDYGYKDGAISGYKLAIDDINKRLTGLGLKKIVEFKNTKEAVGTFITLVEFYKLAYERTINELAEDQRGLL